jgi:hypothetical protein
MVVELFDRNVVIVYWSVYRRVVKNQRCGGSLGECKILAASYQVTNYTILVYTSSVSVLRKKMSWTGYIKTCRLLWCNVFSIIKYVKNRRYKREALDCRSRKWKNDGNLLLTDGYQNKCLIVWRFSVYVWDFWIPQQTCWTCRPWNVILCRLMYNCRHFERP